MQGWEDVIEGLQHQDQDMQLRVYEAYHDQLHICLHAHFFSDSIHRQDCIESGITDAFRELFARPDRFDPAKSNSSDPMLAFLVGMARRRIIDCYRKFDDHDLGLEDIDEERYDVLPSDLALNDAIDDFVSGRIDAAEFHTRLLMRIESNQIIVRLELLNREQAVVWFLKDGASLTVDYIAQVLKRKVDAVEAILRRARVILRRSM